ncbi:MAG: hypothetical protein E7179_04555 [Erysipelotrichaceae bacterium]|nr:hypothetical protein [Erysipelotrichaceae bacterium]
MDERRKRAYLEMPLLISIALTSTSGALLTILGTFIENIFFYGLGCLVAAIILFCVYLALTRIRVERLDGSLEAIEKKIDALALGDFRESDFSSFPKLAKRIGGKLNALPFAEFSFPRPTDLPDERAFFSYLESALPSLSRGCSLVGFYRFDKRESLQPIADKIAGIHRKTAFIFVSGIYCKAELERSFLGLPGRIAAAYYPDFGLGEIRDILLSDEGNKPGLFVHRKKPKAMEEKVQDFLFEHAPLRVGVIHLKKERGTLMKEWTGGEESQTLENLPFESSKVARLLSLAKEEPLLSLSDVSLLDPLLGNALTEISASSICLKLNEIEEDESVLAYLVYGKGKEKEVTPSEENLLSDLVEFALTCLLKERFLIPSTGGSSFPLENIRGRLPRP